MLAVIQRVSSACVTVDGQVKGQINEGFLILLGVNSEDTDKDAAVLAAKISGLRVFTDENDKMNLSLDDINGSALVISNFTLCADCRKGRRPNFINAARPEKAQPLYELFCRELEADGVNKVEKGVFGADMKVELVNDGPVTVTINSKELIK